MPLSMAMLTVVVKDSTSTMTRQAASEARRRAPLGPRSQRIPLLDWPPQSRTALPPASDRVPGAAQLCSPSDAGVVVRPPKDSRIMWECPHRGHAPSAPTALGRHFRRQAGHLYQATPGPRSGMILTQASLTTRIDLLMLAIVEVVAAGFGQLGPRARIRCDRRRRRGWAACV